ncbi:hypothetical protein N7537_003802 [Penicillium hordei]|uniref:Uncharacterized protein n=1 Tax=Penicillium hordei TaxID=40994 RepID=A0AAD6H5P1_9EURO|nr:uncharacterized protein N7537_003802 [Penicillium hordei]KAJ5607183.1 hypothetical protein N7537_003802 [Penicillium hordei]
MRRTGIDGHPTEGQDGTPTAPKRNQQEAGIGREKYPTQPRGAQRNITPTTGGAFSERTQRLVDDFLRRTGRTVRGNTSRPNQEVSTPNEAEAEEPTSDHQLAPVETGSGTTEPSEPAIEVTGALLPED